MPTTFVQPAPSLDGLVINEPEPSVPADGIWYAWRAIEQSREMVEFAMNNLRGQLSDTIHGISNADSEDPQVPVVQHLQPHDDDGDGDDEMPGLLPPSPRTLTFANLSLGNRLSSPVSLTGLGCDFPPRIFIPSCPNSCIHYSGQFTNHIFCPMCDEPRPGEIDGNEYEYEVNMDGDAVRRVQFTSPSSSPESPGWGEGFPRCGR